jgi:hypothetical protein
MQPTIEMLAQPVPISDAETSSLAEISCFADHRRCLGTFVTSQ